MSSALLQTARRAALVGVAAATVVAGASALGSGCAEQDMEAGAIDGPRDAASPSPRDAGVLPPSLVEDGVLLVHAASVPALRLCFTARPDDLPVPVSTLMPESNVPGLDVGTAARVSDFAGPYGQIVGFPEPALRFLPNAPCRVLLEDSALGPSAYRLGSLDADFSEGLHLLAITGCDRASRDPVASVERCGADWTPTDGNLEVVVQRLTPRSRSSFDVLPVQIVQLSKALRDRATGGLSFGIRQGRDAPVEDFVEGDVPFGAVHPEVPAEVPVPEISDPAQFATTEIVVRMRGDAGASLALAQSLVDTQRLSLPSALPPELLATLSSVVVLSVGELEVDPDVDAGRDARTRLHLLVLPLAVPDEGDAGAR